MIWAIAFSIAFGCLIGYMAGTETERKRHAERRLEERLEAEAREAPEKEARKAREDAIDGWIGDQWSPDPDHPDVESACQRVREIILGVDPRIGEGFKNKPTFTLNGEAFASFNPAKKFVSLSFHRGADIRGNHPRLQGVGAHARLMRFTDEDDVDEAQAELEAVVRAAVTQMR